MINYHLRQIYRGLKSYSSCLSAEMRSDRFRPCSETKFIRENTRERELFKMGATVVTRE